MDSLQAYPHSQKTLCPKCTSPENSSNLFHSSDPHTSCPSPIHPPPWQECPRGGGSAGVAPPPPQKPRKKILPPPRFATESRPPLPLFVQKCLAVPVAQL